MIATRGPAHWARTAISGGWAGMALGQGEDKTHMNTAPQGKTEGTYQRTEASLRGSHWPTKENANVNIKAPVAVKAGPCWHKPQTKQREERRAPRQARQLPSQTQGWPL